MKQLYLAIGFCVLQVSLVFGQAPQGINYQAILWDDSVALANTNVVVKIILASNESSNMYEEYVPLQTNERGLINLVIGEHNTGFESIDWKNHHDVRVIIEYSLNGGVSYQGLGEHKLQSVPYALYAPQNYRDTLDTLTYDASTGILTIQENGKIHQVTLNSSSLDCESGYTKVGSTCIQDSSFASSVGLFSAIDSAKGAGKRLCHSSEIKQAKSDGLITGSNTEWTFYTSSGNTGTVFYHPGNKILEQNVTKTYAFRYCYTLR